MSKKKMLVRLLLTLVLIEAVGYGMNRVLGQSLELDLFTQKHPFDGRGLNEQSDAFSYSEEVFLYAQVSYNNYPVNNVFVAYDVRGPQGFYFIGVKETNSSGIAQLSFRVPNYNATLSGEWRILARVQLGEESAEDQLTFKVGFIVNIISMSTVDEALQPRTVFSPGTMLNLDLLLENIGLSAKNVTIVAVAKDEMEIIIGSSVVDFFEALPGRNSLQTSIHVPLDAAVGIGKIYVCVLTAPLSEKGTPFCPESFTEFLIGVRDVGVLKITPSMKNLEAGHVINVRISVRNKGSLTESFNVKLYINQSLLETFQVTFLQPSADANLDFSLDTRDLHSGIFMLRAYASHLPGELATENNYAETIITIEASLQPPLDQPLQTIALPKWLTYLLFAILIVLIASTVILFCRRKKKREFCEPFEKAWKAWYEGTHRTKVLATSKN